ncbi:MAG: hypothetical protein AAGE90_20840, partial [Pseudomonadota bacterium]
VAKKAMAVEPNHTNSPYDFAASDLTDRLREAGTELALDRKFDHVPPMDLLYFQRKLGGMYMLATRLGARVDLGALIAPWLETPAMPSAVAARERAG